MFLFPDFYEYKDSFSESLKILNNRRELAEEVKSFEWVGYAYIKYNLESKSDLIRIPCGEICTERGLNEDLTPLKFGDKAQLQALEHLNYFHLARKYYNFRFP